MFTRSQEVINFFALEISHSGLTILFIIQSKNKLSQWVQKYNNILSQILCGLVVVVGKSI